MSDSASVTEDFHRYFNTTVIFNSKIFDKNIKAAAEYAGKNGLPEDYLVAITKLAFSQDKLALYLIQTTVKSLIPRTRVPDQAVENVLNYLLKTYNKDVPLLSLKVILQWLAGLVEYKLADVKLINDYYEVYFHLLITYLDACASKLLYLLTKPVDISRSRVKQLFRLFKNNGNPRHVGALLYLFKTQRPEQVPERVLAYSLYSAFPNLPPVVQEGFKAAAQRLHCDEHIEESTEDIVWIKTQFGRKMDKKSAIYMIQNVALTESKTSIIHEKPTLLSVTNAKELFKYEVVCEIPNRVLSLLYNTAGMHILSFSKKSTQEKFSYQVYAALHEAFLECNPNVPYEEKEKILSGLAMLQIQIQQPIPVLSRFAADYLSRWNGYDHASHIYQLLQWLHFSSFDELHDCILQCLYDLFISGSVSTQRDILKCLAKFTANIILTYRDRKTKKIPNLFLDYEPKWDFEEVITNLYLYIQRLCALALYMNQDVSLRLSVIQLNHTIIGAESRTNLHRWIVPTTVASFVFSSRSPPPLVALCDIFNKYPNTMNDDVKELYINCWLQKTETEYTENYSSKRKMISEAVNLSRKFSNIKHHMAFACYNYEFLSTTEIGEKFFQHMQEYYPDVFEFLVTYGLSNKKKKKR